MSFVRQSHIGVVGFIRVRRDYFESAVVCILDGCVHLGAPRESSGSLLFVGFIGARPCCSRVSFGHALRVVGRFVVYIHSGAPWGALGPYGHSLGIVGFIRICWVHSHAP